MVWQNFSDALLYTRAVDETSFAGAPGQDDLADLDVSESDGIDDNFLEEGQRLLRGAEAKLAAVERALHRIDSGTYGLCEICGQPIDPSLLSEHPGLARCVEHDESEH